MKAVVGMVRMASHQPAPVVGGQPLTAALGVAAEHDHAAVQAPAATGYFRRHARGEAGRGSLCRSGRCTRADARALRCMRRAGHAAPPCLLCAHWRPSSARRTTTHAQAFLHEIKNEPAVIAWSGPPPARKQQPVSTPYAAPQVGGYTPMPMSAPPARPKQPKPSRRSDPGAGVKPVAARTARPVPCAWAFAWLGGG